jgi:hypothetical protein
MSGACGRGRGGAGAGSGLCGAGEDKTAVPSPGRRQVPLSDANAWRYTQFAGGAEGGAGGAISGAGGLPRAFISTGTRVPATEHTPLRVGPCSDEV